MTRGALRVLAGAAVLSAAVWACGEPSAEVTSEPGQLRLVPLPPIDGERAGGMGFGGIADLEIGDDGSVFVLDGMSRRVRVFDDEGEPLGSFGSPGRGPEELERPVALAWGPDGHLWVADTGNGRFAVFEASGGFVGTHPIRSNEPVLAVEAVRFLDEGRLATVHLEPEGGSLERLQASLVESEVVDGELRERGRTRLPFVEWPPIFRHEAGGSLLVLPVPFSTEPLFRIGPDGGLWYAHTREPWVHRWSPAGGVERTVGRTFEPPPVTAGDMEQVREDAAELRQASPEAFAELTDLIPDTRPHLAGFFLDDEGRVWILRSAPAGEKQWTMDVYEPEGDLVASVRLALEPEPAPRVRDGLLVGVVRDELGVESVVRYGIRH